MIRHDCVAVTQDPGTRFDRTLVPLDRWERQDR